MALAVLSAVGSGACTDNSELEPEVFDFEFYRCEVEPVLLAGCAFARCHADPGRPFRLAHPHLMRYNSSALPLGSATRASAKLGLAEHETELNFLSAMAMAQSTSDGEESLLIRKPMDEDIGGAFHKGREIFGGGDVFDTLDDPRLVTFRAWVAGSHGETTCD